MAEYYVDISGNYLGGFCGCLPPDGAVEVASPPEHGADRWTGNGWDKSGRPAPKLTKDELKIKLAAANSVAGLRQVIDDILETIA